MLKVNFYILLFLLIVSVTSCKKESTQQAAQIPQRTIRFQLYTSKDFSAENNSIQFTLSIKNTSTNQAIWDSILPSIKIKDIPGVANKLVWEKTVSGTDGILQTGFLYAIPGVGNSWFLDTCGKTTKLKIIDYNFQ